MSPAWKELISRPPAFISTWFNFVYTAYVHTAGSEIPLGLTGLLTGYVHRTWRGFLMGPCYHLRRSPSVCAGNICFHEYCIVYIESSVPVLSSISLSLINVWVCRSVCVCVCTLLSIWPWACYTNPGKPANTEYNFFQSCSLHVFIIPLCQVKSCPGINCSTASPEGLQWEVIGLNHCLFLMYVLRFGYKNNLVKGKNRGFGLNLLQCNHNRHCHGDG